MAFPIVNVHLCPEFKLDVFFIFQFADSDGAESGFAFEALGHGGRGPPHVPDHKESSEGED